MMELVKIFLLWANVIFSGTILGLLLIVGISMALEKIIKLNMFAITSVAFILAVILSVILGGYGIHGEGSLMHGHSDFLRAFVVSIPGFTIAWLLIISGVVQKTVKKTKEG